MSDLLAAMESETTESSQIEPSILNTAPAEESKIDNAAQVKEITFPAKYTVKNEDGSVNFNETVRKLNDGYSHLARKMGETGGLFPDSAEGYDIKIDTKELGLPEGITAEILKTDPDFKDFISKAHESGLTNDQLNFVVGGMLKEVQEVLDRRFDDDKASAQKALSEHWVTPSEMSKNLSSARRAFEHFASDEDKAELDSIGNNPVVIRLLARIGNAMSEDAPVLNKQSAEARQSLQDIMRSEAYLNPKHEGHAAAEAQVAKYYRHKYGNDPVV